MGQSDQVCNQLSAYLPVDDTGELSTNAEQVVESMRSQGKSELHENPYFTS